MKKLLLFSLVMLLAVGAAGCKKGHKGHHDDDDDDSSKSELSSDSVKSPSSSKSNMGKDFSYEDDPETYEDLVHDFLEAIDFEKNFENRMVQSGVNDPGLLRELRAKVPPKLVEIYSKYYTANELKQLTNLYQDKIYKRFKQLEPQITQDYNQAGYAIGKGVPSPIEQIEVPSEFADAMEDYLEAQNFDEQLEKLRPLLMQSYNLSSDQVDVIIKKMPLIMTNIYSKYFSVSDIKQLTLMERLPILKKYREREVDMTTEIMQETQKIAMDYYNRHEAK